MKSQLHDPDPIIVDLLVNLLATGVAGAIIKVGKNVFDRRSRIPQSGHTNTKVEIKKLRELLSDLKGLAENASLLVKPQEKLTRRGS